MIEEDQTIWLTISEASKLKKKSKTTIWRLIKRVLESPDKDKIKVEEVETKGFRKNFRYLIEKSFLLKPYETIETINATNLKRSETKGETISEAIAQRNETILKDKNELISFLKHRLFLSDKDKKTKDYQISMLIKGQKDTNFLLAQLQNKVKLLEAPKKWWWRKNKAGVFEDRGGRV